MSSLAKIDSKAPAITPMEMLSAAVNQGADLDKLEKLMDLQQRWEANEARKAFSEALAGFQSELGPIIKRQIVDYTTQKGRTTFAFANIDDIAQAIRPMLDKHRLSYRFEQAQEGQSVTVTCYVTHAMGHCEKAALTATADGSGGKNAIQAVASTVTYLRRYTLTGVLGITTGDQDNDGGKPSITVDELLEYMNVVREEIHSVAAVKMGLANEDYSGAKEAWHELSEEVQRALWRAPTRGGIFTTKERAQMKSTEWSSAE